MKFSNSSNMTKSSLDKIWKCGMKYYQITQKWVDTEKFSNNFLKKKEIKRKVPTDFQMIANELNTLHGIEKSWDKWIKVSCIHIL